MFVLALKFSDVYVVCLIQFDVIVEMVRLSNAMVDGMMYLYKWTLNRCTVFWVRVLENAFVTEAAGYSFPIMGDGPAA
jgi:hypothetical protein